MSLSLKAPYYLSTARYSRVRVARESFRDDRADAVGNDKEIGWNGSAVY